MNKKISSSNTSWIVFLIIGILCFITGVWVINEPLLAVMGIALCIGAFILISGISNLFIFLSDRYIPNRLWFLIFSILEIICGGYLLFNPKISVEIFPIFIGVWMLFRGTAILSTSWMFRKEQLHGSEWLTLFGVLTIICGILALLSPIFAVTYVSIMMAICFLTCGIYSIYFALRVRKLNN